MSVLRLKYFYSPLRQCTRYSSTLAQENEYTATPQYPPILDLSLEKVRERQYEKEAEIVKSVKTVEEKQIKLNMPKYYGFKCYMLQEDYIPYNNLNLIQYVTRTHLIQNEQLPDHYKSINVDNVEKLRGDIEDAILFELEGYRKFHDIKCEELDKVQLENLISKNLSRQINRVLLNNLKNTYPHLKEVKVDIDSRIESFWYVGGMNPPENVRRSKRGLTWLKDKENEPVNRAMNYIGSANLALRFTKPLSPIITLSEVENSDLTVPQFQLDPRTVGTTTDHRHIANIPGFWPGESAQFGLLSYHRRGHFLTRHYKDAEDDKEALHRQGILTSFGWLNSQAALLGFTSFNDLTYPLVTQTIITNGQMWSFYVYQLNTIINHSKYVKENLRRNICWTNQMKLYEQMVDGKFVGFNDEVLKNLIRFYGNVPEDHLGINLRPYLSQDEKVCADYVDDDKRQWLEREYKYLVANRPRFKLNYEVYAWEKIYKIDHKTRFMDKKIRPFELGENPYNRRLDDRKPRYIPRALRPDLPRHKGRDAKEYFP